MDIGQQLVIGLGILLAVWYVLATAYNRRRGVNTFRWIQAGVGIIGKVSEARWIGTSGSGARLVIAQADRPFRRVEIAFLLESRELMPLWLINRLLRRRRDLMILKADLRKVPVGQFEVVRARRGRWLPDAEAPSAKRWRRASGDWPVGLMAAERGARTDQVRRALTDWLEAYAGAIRRLSLAPTSAHMILEIDLPPLTTRPADEFFTRLKEAISRLAGQPEETEAGS
jgi:hypothetical protein